MLVRNGLESTNLGNLKPANTAKENNKSISSGQKLQENENAAELTISNKLQYNNYQNGNVADAANENILSAQSSIYDVEKAEEMIREANQNILNQADDAVKVQSGQNVQAVMELLK